MKTLMIKETIIYISLFFILAFSIHPDLLFAPYERFSRMTEQGNSIHIFLFTSALYIVLFIIRFIFKKIISFIKR